MAIETKTNPIGATRKQGPRNILGYEQQPYASLDKMMEEARHQTIQCLAEEFEQGYDKPPDAAKVAKQRCLWDFPLQDVDRIVPLGKRIQWIRQLKVMGYSEKGKGRETHVLRDRTTGPLAAQGGPTSLHEHGEGRPTKRGAPPRQVPLPQAADAAAGTRRKLDRELAAFESMRRDLVAQYDGLFVAVHRGQVIDADPDDFCLARRVEATAIREGPVAICKVYDQAQEPCAPCPFAEFESPEPAEGY